MGERYWDDGFKAIASTKAVPTLETRVIDSTGDTTVLWQDSELRFLQVYTGLREQGAIAVEPMSGQTDCYNNGDVLIVLQAGEVWETAMGVRLESQ